MKELHELVMSFRSEASEWWKTPSPQDCLRYAFTEAGEAMDAHLRNTRPGDARNNERFVPNLESRIKSRLGRIYHKHIENHADDDQKARILAILGQ